MPPPWTHTPPGALLLWPDAQQVILISFSSNGLLLCWIKTVVKLFSTSCRRVLQGDLETSSGDGDRGRGLRIDEVWNLVTMFSRFKALMTFISLLGSFLFISVISTLVPETPIPLWGIVVLVWRVVGLSLREKVILVSCALGFTKAEATSNVNDYILCLFSNPNFSKPLYIVPVKILHTEHAFTRILPIKWSSRHL